MSITPSIQDFQKAVALAAGVSIDDLTGPSRRREVTEPRHIAIYMVHRSTPATLKSIGRAFGGRDHSTVKYAIQTVENLIRIDSRFWNKYNAIEKATDQYLAEMLLTPSTPDNQSPQ